MFKQTVLLTWPDAGDFLHYNVDVSNSYHVRFFFLLLLFLVILINIIFVECILLWMNIFTSALIHVLVDF